MSVSVSQQPEDYTPGYNPQLFVALSTQVAQDNFTYTVEITDLITGDDIQYQIAADPEDDRCYFDAMPFVENYLRHFIPINETGWEKCVDGIRKIRVNIGETYGATGAETHYPGSNIDYIVWNGVEDYLTHPSYDKNDYVFDSSTGNFVFLTTSLDETTYEGKSNYLYALTSASGDLETLIVNTYAADGSAIGSTSIPYADYLSTTYTDKYICIDIGHKGLSNILVGETTGDYPIITSSVAYYDLAHTSGSPPAGFPAFKRIYIGCEREYDVYTVHFWAKNGRFETIHFNKRSDTTLRKQDTTYEVTPYTRSGGSMTYSRSSPIKRILGSSRTEVLRLCTDWLTEAQIVVYQEILDSAYIYLDTESLDFPQLTLRTDTYEIFKNFNEPLFQLTMEFEYSHKNHRQR